VGTESEHITQATRNFEFGSGVDVSEWIGRQWAVTVFFYCGVHCVEAAWASATPGNVPPGTYAGRHDWREAWMDLNAQPPLSRAFKRLRIASQRARYDLVKTSEAERGAFQADARAILNRTRGHQLAVRS
jgi:hypothetical protein